MSGGKAYCSVPPECVARRVWVRWDGRVVRIFDQNDQVVTREFGSIGPHFPTDQPYAVVPNNFTQVDRLKLGVNLPADTRFYAQLQTGDTHNRTFARQEVVAFAEGLGLKDLVFYHVSNTDADPMDKSKIDLSEGVIDRYLQHAKGLPAYGALQQRGEELRRRLHKVGIQWEPELLIIGVK